MLEEREKGNNVFNNNLLIKLKNNILIGLINKVTTLFTGNDQPKYKDIRQGKLWIVSNRLPITVVQKENKIEYLSSSGGLATGLGSYFSGKKIKDYIWLGWPGGEIAGDQQSSVSKELLEKHNNIPVFLNEAEMDKFYLGFCNKTIWPLFHYFPAYTEFVEENWLNYKEINEKFCNELVKHLTPNDTVWIHDYHLMLLPKMLRTIMPELKIGFFLHIPFPFYELVRLLPKEWREEILEGLLGSDLIGFHVHSYVQYFLSTVLRILGLEHNTGRITYENRFITVDSFPMGIDYEKFFELAKTKEINEKCLEIKESNKDQKIILSIDRLDYTKGIHKRLLSYEKFLNDNPEWHKKVVLMIIIIPSRIGVDSYQSMKKTLDEEIGRINGRFTALNWSPIVYQYKSVDLETLVALYKSADIALVTPLRDGMNLIAKEYLASHLAQDGVLILSEMAGAANELTEAIIINPNTKEEIATAIKEALAMPIEEQKRRNSFMHNRIKNYDVFKWADSFLEQLNKNDTTEIKSKYLNQVIRDSILNRYRNSSKRVIFLDYDGTVVPFSKSPFLAKPPSSLLDLIGQLSKKNEVVLISGRDKNTLTEWFGSMDIVLSAEHGVWLKNKSKEWEKPRDISNTWKKQISSIMEKYANIVPGTFIENKDYSVAWHYRMADQEQALSRKKELLDDLVHYTANVDLSVLQGNKVVEVRNSTVNKGTIVHDILAKDDYDFIICLGDDMTDEDMFRNITKRGISIKVGRSETNAKYYVNSYKDVVKLLGSLQ